MPETQAWISLEPCILRPYSNFGRIPRRLSSTAAGPWPNSKATSWRSASVRRRSPETTTPTWLEKPTTSGGSTFLLQSKSKMRLPRAKKPLHSGAVSLFLICRSVKCLGEIKQLRLLKQERLANLSSLGCHWRDVSLLLLSATVSFFTHLPITLLGYSVGLKENFSL